MSSRRFREYDLDQGLLLPPSLEDWLPDGHLAFFISDVVDGLDVSRMLADYESPDGKGAPPYHPRMLLNVVIGLVSRRSSMAPRASFTISWICV